MKNVWRRETPLEIRANKLAKVLRSKSPPTVSHKARLSMILASPLKSTIANGDRCEICGAAALKSELCQDHDHRTGVLRGRLCNRHNLMLGFAGDNPAELEAGAHYLAKYQIYSLPEGP